MRGAFFDDPDSVNLLLGGRFLVQTQTCFPFVRVGAMALKASVGKDGSDLAGKGDRFNSVSVDPSIGKKANQGIQANSGESLKSRPVVMKGMRVFHDQEHHES